MSLESIHLAERELAKGDLVVVGEDELTHMMARESISCPTGKTRCHVSKVVGTFVRRSRDVIHERHVSLSCPSILPPTFSKFVPYETRTKTEHKQNARRTYSGHKSYKGRLLRDIFSSKFSSRSQLFTFEVVLRHFHSCAMHL
ncbi:protein of unknown function [Cupriavidus neocaledonicus]|uniref:Uncharacterized protein n=1 Tax=Cupriavidus neocaledonicus TaxID=1040979 RepID=A0A375HBZ5_9BURK|nr:protein of unknown function [Cupriavidus neocaledonicus]